MILITGGAGFVGSNLAIAIKKNNPKKNIVVIDNLKRRGSELNLLRLKENKINFIHGDIRNAEDLEISKSNVSTIVECSAEPSVVAGYNDQLSYLFNTNLLGTLNCLNLAKKHKSNFIFLSSNRIYPFEKINKIKFIESSTRFEMSQKQSLPGVNKFGVDENFSIHGPKTFYGTSKLSSEFIIQEYSHAYNLKTIINRCGVIAGPWQMGKIDQGIFSYWMMHHYFKKELSYMNFGSLGKQVRDLIHVDDLSRLIIKQLASINKINNKIYNVGGGIKSNLSLLETSNLCSEITGNHIKIKKNKITRQNDIRLYISNINKVKKDYSWEIKNNPKNILTDIFEWIEKNETNLKKYFA